MSVADKGHLYQKSFPLQPLFSLLEAGRGGGGETGNFSAQILPFEPRDSRIYDRDCLPLPYRAKVKVRVLSVGRIFAQPF